jgi:DNA-binding beta-propeller fold protein YncE
LGAGTVPIRVTGNLSAAYVLDQFGPAVDVVQDFGGAPVRIPLLSKPRSIALDSAHKLIWVGLADNRLEAIRSSDHQVLGTVALPLDPDRLAVLPREVVAQQDNPVRLVRVDSTRLRVIGPAVTPPGAPTSASTLISYNDTVLSTLEFPVRLEQFNASLQRIADHPIGVALPTEMAVDSNGVLWVTDYDAARVWRLDPSSGTPVAPALPVGQDPTWMAASGGYVWVANAGDDTINVINEQFNTLTNESMPIGSSAGPLAPADATGNAWMASGTQLLQLQPNS